MPTALVTSSPERVPDVATALRSAGFDILAGGPMSADDIATRLLSLLTPSASVVRLTDGTDPSDGAAGGDPDQRAIRSIVKSLAEAILSDCGRAGVRVTAVGEKRAAEDIAALDPELDFADWRTEALCLASLRDT